MSETSRTAEWWDRWFLGLAEYIATASKDPSTKVGAVIIDKARRIISTGYNGLSRKNKDTAERLHNRELKYKMIIHAEKNAILFAHGSLEGCTLYTWPFMPCSGCASFVSQSGITRVVSPFSDNPRWIDDFKLSEELFQDAGIELVIMNCHPDF